MSTKEQVYNNNVLLQFSVSLRKILSGDFAKAPKTNVKSDST